MQTAPTHCHLLHWQQ